MAVKGKSVFQVREESYGHEGIVDLPTRLLIRMEDRRFLTEKKKFQIRR